MNKGQKIKEEKDFILSKKEELEIAKLQLEVKELEKPWLKKKEMKAPLITSLSLLLITILSYILLGHKIRATLDLESKILDYNKIQLHDSVNQLRILQKNLFSSNIKLTDSLKKDYQNKKNKFDSSIRIYDIEINQLKEATTKLKTSNNQLYENNFLSQAKNYYSILKYEIYNPDNVYHSAIDNLLSEKDSIKKAKIIRFYENIVNSDSSLYLSLRVYPILISGTLPKEKQNYFLSNYSENNKYFQDLISKLNNNILKIDTKCLRALQVTNYNLIIKNHVFDNFYTNLINHFYKKELDKSIEEFDFYFFLFQSISSNFRNELLEKTIISELSSKDKSFHQSFYGILSLINQAKFFELCISNYPKHKIGIDYSLFVLKSSNPKYVNLKMEYDTISWRKIINDLKK